MPLALVYPANTLSSGFSVDNSCRFNGDAYVHRTFGSAGNVDRWTFSAWFKIASSSGNICLFAAAADSNNYGSIVIKTDGSIEWQHYASASAIGILHTNRKLRDHSAWYNLICVYDSANGTAGDRMKMYINGTEETSFATDTNPSSGQDSPFNKDDIHSIGAQDYAGGSFQNYWNGYLAEVVFLDGTAASATDFGEFDEDSPTIWKPIDVSGLTFGTNGFYLDFEDSSNLGNDANGGTDYTEVSLAAADQSVDTPTNNACTLNSLAVATSGATTFSEGNNKIVYAASSGWRPAFGTFPVSEGKWYFEVKGLLFPGTSYCQVGWVSLEYTANGNSALTDEISGWGNLDPAVVYDSRLGNIYYQFVTNNSNDTSYGDSFGAGDIISCALDLDNSKIYFAENGTWKNSGDPESGSTGTGAHSILSGYTWVPFIGINNVTAEATFASPVQANSSGNADENGYGDFEYAPPSGYLSICSKNTA